MGVLSFGLQVTGSGLHVACCGFLVSGFRLVCWFAGLVRLRLLVSKLQVTGSGLLVWVSCHWLLVAGSGLLVSGFGCGFDMNCGKVGRVRVLQYAVFRWQGCSGV